MRCRRACPPALARARLRRRHVLCYGARAYLGRVGRGSRARQSGGIVGTPATTAGWPAGRVRGPRRGCSRQGQPRQARNAAAYAQWRGARPRRWPVEQRAGVQGSKRPTAPSTGAALDWTAAVGAGKGKSGRKGHEWLAGMWGNGSAGRSRAVATSVGGIVRRLGPGEQVIKDGRFSTLLGVYAPP